MTPERLEEILLRARLPRPASGGIEITGTDPALASRYPAAEAAACALALAANSAARLHEQRGGPPQDVRVSVEAAAQTLLGFFFLRSDRDLDLARQITPLTDLYADARGRFIHLHGGFPHLAQGILDILDSAPERGAIARAVHQRDAFELEEEIAEKGFCAGVVRGHEEWASHPQGLAMGTQPAVEILKIGEAEPRPLPPLGAQPLAGLRVLDLTRVLAGPTCARTLADHGADVLRVGAPHLPSVEPFVIETGRGKRNAFLDLRKPEDARELGVLSTGADVFCQGYRAGSLEKRGFGAEQLAEQSPGLIYVSINCYGHLGPWRARAGWEQLAQSVSGIAQGEGGAESPRLIPAAATDYTTGYLAAYGVMEALRRRAREGGTWHVRASLVQTAMWFTRLGDGLDPEAARGLGDAESRLMESDTHWGKLRSLGPVVEMSATRPGSGIPPSPLGTHPPRWLEPSEQ